MIEFGVRNSIPDQRGGLARKIHLLFLPIFLTGLCACSYTFTRVEGKSIEDCASSEIVLAAEDAFSTEDYERAVHLAEYVAEEHPDSPEAEDALYLAAESYFRMNEPKESLVLFKELIARYPASRYSNLIAERDFAIGRALFADDSWFFGEFTRDRGVDAMNHLLTEFSTSELADDARIEMGLHFFAEEEYIDAIETFTELIKENPGSEWEHKALFLMGLSYFNINRGASYDRESLRKCMVVLNTYKERYPLGAYLDQCDEVILEAQERMAEKELEIALFYLDQDQEIGARRHLANTVILFNGTGAAKRAETILARNGWDLSLNSVDTLVSREREPGNLPPLAR